MSGANLTPEQAVDIALEAAIHQGAAAADALYVEDGSLSVEVFEGAVKNLERSDSCGLGLRVLRDGCPGYSFTERLTREAVESCVRDALAVARLTEPLAIELPEAPELPALDLSTWSDAVGEAGPEAMVALCRRAEDAARAADARIFNVPYLGMTRSEGRVFIGNHRGLRLGRRGNALSFGLGAIARENDVSKMGVESLTSRTLSDFDAERLARIAAERAVSLLGASPVPAGEYSVVFDNRVSATVVGLFAGSFLAESVQHGQSRLVGREGQTIASPCFTMATDPHLRGQGGSRLFDGEGIVCHPREIVSQGVLNGFLHNLESSCRAGIAPTGDAARGYRGKVGSGFSNLVVRAGSMPLEGLLAAHPRCLHIVKLEGASGCNGVSGEISIGAQGFLVENGRAVRPVDRITLSGNFFDLLHDVESVGDSYRPGIHSSFVPALLVRRMQVGG